MNHEHNIVHTNSHKYCYKNVFFSKNLFKITNFIPLQKLQRNANLYFLNQDTGVCIVPIHTYILYYYIFTLKIGKNTVNHTCVLVTLVLKVLENEFSFKLIQKNLFYKKSLLYIYFFLFNELKRHKMHFLKIISKTSVQIGWQVKKKTLRNGIFPRFCDKFYLD